MSTLVDIIPDVLTEFLEIAVHNVVKVKNLYPESVFTKKQKYGAVVYQITHPKLKEYISKCMEAVHYLAQKNELSKVVICFVKAPCILVERVVFNITDLKQQFEKDPYLLKTERMFRSFFVRLHSTTSYVDPLPDDVTFTILIHTTESDGVSYMETYSSQFPWIEANKAFKELEVAEIVPVETINSDCLHIQIYIEKSI